MSATKLDDRQNHVRDVARTGRFSKVGYCAIITGGALMGSMGVLYLVSFRTIYGQALANLD